MLSHLWFHSSSYFFVVGFTVMQIGVQTQIIESLQQVFCVYLGNNLVSWGSHRELSPIAAQKWNIVGSTAATLTEILWISSLLQELCYTTTIPTIYSNNLGAVLLSSNPITHSRSKHFKLDQHFVCVQVQQKQVRLVHLPGRFNGHIDQAYLCLFLQQIEI